ncbi:MAG TPA: methylated-DNA--[protein]-cysteine S-methyltransferase [Desulfobacteraceae bacterium]|nr:methylated-DNA--[protein]-cysteine S-methyltransferase [Desulfobacteraceae bacterium]HPJ67130.1 methylated-DNA--[protein]-cysteine S-methyltransferase [Desulfobacteraceae bacterium]HPQ28342.1 methylated-DNA--[protein]-cysteine S-methyltransferase [Desulfobacteraceae bacterium]
MINLSKILKNSDKLYRNILKSPIGMLTLLGTEYVLKGILFEKTSRRHARILTSIEKTADNEILCRTENQIIEYFSGTRQAFDIPFDVEGTPFQKSVWELLLEIPYGQTTTYGEIARRLGDRKKARPVGNAVGFNPVPIIIPCHRVIGNDGSLTGFGGGLEIKSFLLNLEAPA